MIVFIGPSLLSGIGQHLAKYMKLFPESKYLLITDEIPKCEIAFLFALPIEPWLTKIPYIKTRANKVACMTVCETQTVHPDYGKLFELFDRIAVPSEFCKNVFSKQFPDTEFYLIHAYIPRPLIPDKPYVFYYIGNVIDQRKNFKPILEAFVRLNKPDTKLLIKATCSKNIEINIPRVEVINGLIEDAEMDKIHEMGDCYVSFSRSEGVGMGAVEAAIRDKPVIITDFGGAAEYIKTPYTINCTLTEVPRDDFLFTKGMIWGEPDYNQLCEYMLDAYDKKLKFMEHTHTKNITSSSNVLKEFLVNISGEISN